MIIASNVTVGALREWECGMFGAVRYMSRIDCRPFLPLPYRPPAASYFLIRSQFGSLRVLVLETPASWVKICGSVHSVPTGHGILMAGMVC